YRGKSGVALSSYYKWCFRSIDSVAAPEQSGLVTRTSAQSKPRENRGTQSHGADAGIEEGQPSRQKRFWRLFLFWEDAMDVALNRSNSLVSPPPMERGIQSAPLHR